MRIYCSLCDKVQPAQVDDCKDVKTGELYQDIVCGECGLVITSGTGIKRQWVGLTDKDCEEVERWVEFKEEGSGRIPTGKLIRYIEAKLKENNT